MKNIPKASYSINIQQERVRKVIVFYDGKCNICVKAKNLIVFLDKHKLIKFVNLWKFQNPKRYKFKKQDLHQELHLITDRDDVYRGYFAVKYILLIIKRLGPIEGVLKTSFVDNLGVRVYEFIARNRYKLSYCKSCNI